MGKKSPKISESTGENEELLFHVTCQYCDKNFSTKSKLQTHMKDFHNVDKDDDLEMIVDKTPTKKSSTIQCQVMPSKRKPKQKSLQPPNPKNSFVFSSSVLNVNSVLMKWLF